MSVSGVIRPTLSVVAISRNEEADLPGFLGNLLEWVDEIVIVDDNSVDKTVAIAESAGSKVKLVRHPMCEDTGFAGQRNAGIAEASGDWVLNMDIDERVPPELAEEIMAVIATSNLNAFRYRRLNFFLHRPMRAGGWTSWNNPQLARRGCHYYVNRVHECCVVDGEPATVGQLEACMWHLNDESYVERMRKSFQYSQMEADKLLATGKIAKPWSLLLRPLKVFLVKYVIKAGFRDGTPGLISALHAADAEFRCIAQVWDSQNRIPRETLEIAVNKLHRER